MDSDLAATGKDVSVTFTFDGATVKTYEVVEHEVEEMIERTETKPLGTTKRLINTEPLGWRVRLTLDESRKDTEELVDIIVAAEELRVPSVMAVAITTRYRDLTSKTYVYPDVKRTSFRRTGRRGDAMRIVLELETGITRIAA